MSTEQLSDDETERVTANIGGVTVEGKVVGRYKVVDPENGYRSDSRVVIKTNGRTVNVSARLLEEND